MKRICILLIAVALIAAMMGCDGNGDGTPSECLEIRDWYDLDEVRNNLEGYYCLMNDLDSTKAGYEELASPTANGGKGWEPIAFQTEFEGILDGQGYEIKDLFINRPNIEASDAGLFYIIGVYATVKDVGVVNADVIGRDYVGALVSDNEGTVSNCYATGRVTGRMSVGGLVGINGGNVSNSYSTCNVTGEEHVAGLLGGQSADATVSNSYSTGGVSGGHWVGGLMANNSGIIDNSYSTGNVTGEDYVGGLLGLSNTGGIISNSYSTGNVTGENYVGGLVGDNQGGTVSNSFWDTETSGQDSSDGGTGKNTMEMQDITTFSGAAWDIVAVANPSIRNTSYIWNIVDDETYPFLSWEP